jgi:hypothetical protein
VEKGGGAVKTKITKSFWANIYMAANLESAEQVCREFCLSGMCVTVTRTNYIYTKGEESGVVVGLLNYPRFPRSDEQIITAAKDLGNMLMERCCQGSYLIQTPKEAIFITSREADFEVARC